jgi:hypothetical protein
MGVVHGYTGANHPSLLEKEQMSTYFSTSAPQSLGLT